MALLGVLYVIYLISTINLMIAMRAGPPTLTLAHELPQSDFGLFWCAGKGLFAQAVARFGIEAPGTQVFLRTCQVNILSGAAPAALAWPYPPLAGFLVVPFSFIPLAVSFWVWRAFSVVIAGGLLRRAGLGWGVIVAGLASTAALHDLVGGQNGTLIAGVLVSALLLAETRPGLAGLLAGLLAVKPQTALVFPAIVLRPRGMKMLLAGLLTVLAIVALSLAVWGTEGWIWFFKVAEPDEMKQAAAPFTVFFPAAGITVFSMARSLGAGLHAAWAWQAASSVAALGLTWGAWRPGAMTPQPRMALTCALSVLAMPHGFAYDLVAFSIGMAALYPRAGGWERLTLGLLWLMGGYTITLANYTGLVLFPVFAVLGAALAWRLRASPAAR
ncbi:MAG: glycosyltransferase family 87 protein [Acidocella sp.]|nr:glycosyltransferase family 87 protein [Acidocella sp.]